MKNGELEQTAILGGGDPFSPTTKVKPGVLSILGSIEFPEAVEGRRTALAKWIASKDNPLTTRTIRESPVALALRSGHRGQSEQLRQHRQKAHASRSCSTSSPPRSWRKAGA
jgi:hypothetical protein